MESHRIEAIAKDREKGSRELALEALEVLESSSDWAEEPNFQGKVRELCKGLTKVRTGMVMIGNLAARFYDEYSSSGRTSGEVRKVISHLRKELQASLPLLVSKAIPLVKQGDTILTHSYSSTVLSIFEGLSSKGVRAVVTESRPLLEGRKTASLLSKYARTKLIVDAAANSQMKDMDMVMVGADSVLPDGTAINKIGTSLIALSARYHEKPFYVACETWKLAPWQRAELRNSDPIQVSEEKDVEVLNDLFDLTPSSLITGIITEKGILTPEEIHETSTRFRNSWDKLLAIR